MKEPHHIWNCPIRATGKKLYKENNNLVLGLIKTPCCNKTIFYPVSDANHNLLELPEGTVRVFYS